MNQLILLTFLVISNFGCDHGYTQNINGMDGIKLCLDIEKTQIENKVHFTKTILTFHSNKTFTINSDSTDFLNFNGKWDLCCAGSDWGNYIFIIDGFKEQETLLPEFDVKIKNIKMRLFFTSCEN